MADTLTEEKLSELAEALAVDKNLPKLGLKLGFKKNKVDMYLGINNRNDSFDGTSTMLFDWKKKTPRINRISDLKKALIASDLTDFAEDFFLKKVRCLPLNQFVAKQCAHALTNVLSMTLVKLTERNTE